MYKIYLLLDDTSCSAITRNFRYIYSIDLNVLSPLMHVMIDLIKVNDSFLWIQDIGIE